MAESGRNAADQQLARNYAVKFTVETEHGFTVEIAGEGIAAKDVVAFIKGLDAQAHNNGLKPPAPAAAPRAAAAPRQGQAPRQGGRPGGGRQQQQGRGRAVGRYTGPVFDDCPECGADVWDNREKKTLEGWQGPWFGCRDKCGWVIWENNGATRQARDDDDGYR